MRKIKDITLEEIKSGKNWKYYPPIDFSIPMEEWEIEDVDSFEESDHIVYSVILVGRDSNKIEAAVCLKVVGDYDYGGDFCIYENGEWYQAGLKLDPNAELVDEYFANPLEQDNSFYADWDYRGDHRENFKRLSSNL